MTTMGRTGESEVRVLDLRDKPFSIVTRELSLKALRTMAGFAWAKGMPASGVGVLISISGELDESCTELVRQVTMRAVERYGAVGCDLGEVTTVGSGGLAPLLLGAELAHRISSTFWVTRASAAVRAQLALLNVDPVTLIPRLQPA